MKTFIVFITQCQILLNLKALGCYIPSGQNCAFCSYTTFSPTQNLQSTQPLATECTSNQKLMSTYYTSEVFISPQACDSTRQCSGTLLDPYDSLVKAMMLQMVKAQQYMNAQLTFNLAAGIHFVLPSDFTNFPNIKFFRRELWTIILKPTGSTLPSNGQTTSSSQSPVIYLKSDNLFFFVSNQLTIYNIIFDGSDITLGFQMKYVNDANMKQQICYNIPSVGECNMANPQYSQTVQGQRQYSLFNLEIILDLQIAGLAIDPNLQTFIKNNPSIYPSFPPTPTLNLINVVIRNMYTGIVKATESMPGFRGLILTNLGSGYVILNSLTVQQSFFPDGIVAIPFIDPAYLQNADQSRFFGNSTLFQNFNIFGLSLNQYNQWQAGTNFISTSQTAQPNYFSTVFNFVGFTFTVNINNALISNNSISSTLNSVPIYGYVILLFRSQTAGQISFSGLQFQDNINFVLASIEAGVSLSFQGPTNYILRSKIMNDGSAALIAPQYFLLVNAYANQFNIASTIFQNLFGYVVCVQGSNTLFTQVSFQNIVLPPKAYVVLLQINSNGGIVIDQSVISSISGDSPTTSRFAYVISSQNQMTIQNSSIHDCLNISLLDNTQLNYQLHMYNDTVYQMNQFALCLRERFSVVDLNFCNFHDINTSSVILYAEKSTGGNPTLNVASSNFTNIQAKALFSAATINPRQYIQNMIVTNFKGTALIQNCCYGQFTASQLILKNIETLIVIDVGQTIFQLDKLSFISPQNLTFLPSGPIFLNILRETTVSITNAVLYLYNNASIVNADFAQSIVLSNTQIFGTNLGLLFNIQDSTSFQANQLSFVDQSPTSQSLMFPTQQFIFTFTNMQSINFRYVTINSTSGYGLISQQNCDQLIIYRLNANNIQCGNQPCFSSSDQQLQTVFNYSTLTNLSTTSGSFMDFSFCTQIIIINSLIKNILVNSSDSIISVFQSAAVINRTTFQQIQQLISNSPTVSYASAFTFQDTDSLLISNVKVNNSLFTSQYIQVASFATNLVNIVQIYSLRIDTALSIQEPLVLFQEFSNLSIVNLKTQNINSTSSIIQVQTSLKNLVISFQGISCKNNVGQISSCLNLLTDSNFQISTLMVENTQGSIIAVQSSNNAIITITTTRIKNANNSLTQSNVNRMFDFQGCQVTILDFMIQTAFDQQSIFHVQQSMFTVYALQINQAYATDIFSLKNDSSFNLNIFNFDTCLVVFDRCTFNNNESYAFDRILNKSQHGLIQQNLRTQLISSIDSDLTISNSLINGLSNQIFQTVGNSIKIINSYFMANLAATYFNTADTSISIEGTVLDFDTSLQLFSSTNSLPLVQTFVFKNSQVDFGQVGSLGYLYNFQQLNIINSTFKASGIVGTTNTLSLNISNFNKLDLENNVFSQLSNVDGGCLIINVPITVKDLRSIKIKNLTMSQCKAQRMGGAMYIAGPIMGTIDTSSIQRNEANIGGGIVYNAPSVLNSKTMLTISKCQFIANLASNYAGSTMILDQAFQFANITYTANMAVSQANNGGFATQIGNLGVVNYTQVQIIISDPMQVQMMVARQLFEIDQQGVVKIASGQVYSLAMALLDNSGRLVNVDQNSSIQIVPSTGAGTSTLVDNGYSVSQNGIILFNQLKITNTPGQNFTLQFQVNFAYGRLDSSSLVSFKQTTFPMKYYSRFCRRGEIYSQDNTCQICLVNTYSLPDPQDPRLKSQSCSYCPAQALCVQEAIYPKSGNWIMSQTSTLVLPCRIALYCLGKEDLYQSRIDAVGFEQDYYVDLSANMYDQQCVFGQMGVLCQECIPGYFKFTSTTACLPCQGNKALTFFVIIAIVGLLMVYSIYQSKNYMSKNQEGQDQAVLIKIFLNYFQTLSLLGAATLKWSNNITSVFDFTQDFFGTKFNFVSVQCLTLGSVTDPASQFYLNLVVQMLIPFIIFGFNSIYFMISVFITWRTSRQNIHASSHHHEKKLMKHQQNEKDLKSVSLYIIVLNGVVCLHLFYPLLTSTPTSLFYCETVAQDDFGNQIQYLSKNFHIECWTRNFNQWFYGFGVFLSVFFGLGIPSLLCFYMWTYKKDLRELDNTAISNMSSLIKKKQSFSSKKSAGTDLPKLFAVQAGLAVSISIGAGIAEVEPPNKSAIQQEGQEDLKSGHPSHRSQKSMGQFANSNPYPSDKKSLSRLETLKKIKKIAYSKNITRDLHKSMKKKQLKQSEVFLFLIDPYKSKVFYWEIVVLLRKFILIMIGLLTGFSSQDPDNQSVKYLLLNIYLIVFFRLNLKYEPYFSPLFNVAENYSFMVIIMSCLAGIISSVFESVQADIISDIIFFVVNPLYVGMIAFFFYSLQMLSDPQEYAKTPQWLKPYIVRVLNKHKQRNANNTNSSKYEDETSPQRI